MVKLNENANDKKTKWIKKITGKHYNLTIIIVFIIGVILIFSTYAWFFASLNVKVKFFNVIVSNNSGLSISFDGINYDSFVEISEENLINKLKNTYPGNTSQWASMGLRPVSSNGTSGPNDSTFNMYANSNLDYIDERKESRYLTTRLIEENKINADKNYIAFDLFLKNVTGSPMSDNLYLNNGTGVNIESDKISSDAEGLLNSIRFGFVKINSVPLKSDAATIQNQTCNNSCEALIYEPNSTAHNDTSIEKARLYAFNLVDGRYFPTYAVIKEGGLTDIRNTIFGSPNLNTEYFARQNTRTDFSTPLFQIPDGITKVRVYVWIEGQDIDSLETLSDGADISLNINFIKDTAGYDYYD